MNLIGNSITLSLLLRWPLFIQQLLLMFTIILLTLGGFIDWWINLSSSYLPGNMQEYRC